MDARLEVSISGKVISLHGEIDCSNVRDIAEELLRAVSSRSSSLVLDLAGVRYLDSTGIRMLFELADRLDVARQSLVLVVPESSPIRRLLAITRVEDVAVITEQHAHREVG